MRQTSARAEIMAERRRLRRRYGALYDEISLILFKHDPIHIGYTSDEYEPETELILPKIAECASRRDLTGVVHEVFRVMFSPEIAGPRVRYEPISRDIWRLVKERPATKVPA